MGQINVTSMHPKLVLVETRCHDMAGYLLLESSQLLAQSFSTLRTSLVLRLVQPHWSTGRRVPTALTTGIQTPSLLQECFLKNLSQEVPKKQIVAYAEGSVQKALARAWPYDGCSHHTQFESRLNLSFVQWQYQLAGSPWSLYESWPSWMACCQH